MLSCCREDAAILRTLDAYSKKLALYIESGVSGLTEESKQFLKIYVSSLRKLSAMLVHAIGIWSENRVAEPRLHFQDEEKRKTVRRAEPSEPRAQTRSENSRNACRGRAAPLMHSGCAHGC